MSGGDHSILSDILKKRLKDLGFSSLRRFHADHPRIGLSYEALRQAVYASHTPRPETLYKILGAMQFSDVQVRKICGMLYGDYLPIPPPGGETAPGISAASSGAGSEGFSTDPADPEAGGALSMEEPAEIATRLLRFLPRVPLAGNEDFWEVVAAVAKAAERKVRSSAHRPAEQPLLFAGEPEAVYQFLVRKNRIPPFLSRGENLSFSFVEGIDYRDRYRGALIGSVLGDALGAVTQGLTPRDVSELYGERNLPPAPAFSGGSTGACHPPALAVARSFLPDALFEPDRNAAALARAVRRDDPPGLCGFARNLIERALPWHEAGENAPESAPASNVLAIALLHAGSFRRLKLEAGVFASLSHTHPTAIAGAIAQACALARLLHSLPGSLDVISFPRTLSHAVAGIEPERGARPRIGRNPASLVRKLGAELPALLLRRSTAGEMQEALGNGMAAHEGIPFALGCFLLSPGDFGEAIRQAVRHGGDARTIAAMTGALCGAYVGESGIPPHLLDPLAERSETEVTADRLYVLARRETA